MQCIRSYKTLNITPDLITQNTTADIVVQNNTADLVVLNTTIDLITKTLQLILQRSDTTTDTVKH